VSQQLTESQIGSDRADFGLHAQGFSLQRRDHSRLKPIVSLTHNFATFLRSIPTGFSSRGFFSQPRTITVLNVLEIAFDAAMLLHERFPNSPDFFQDRIVHLRRLRKID
jgi:hypothetical protein